MRRDWGQGTCDVVIFEFAIESSSSAEGINCLDDIKF